MKRETSNWIRFVLEDLLPPALKDSRLFLWAAGLFWGDHIKRLADFRSRAPFLTEDEYLYLYTHHPRVHAATDNSDACIEAIAADVVGSSVCDVGCGTGFLLRAIKSTTPRTLDRIVGVDIVLPSDQADGIEYFASRVEALPFPDSAFDTVICTHVLEHILDVRKAIAELRRVARRRLIIVVPQERETRYTFNPHFHFFPYPETFLRVAIPIPASYCCKTLSRDIYYREDIGGTT